MVRDKYYFFFFFTIFCLPALKIKAGTKDDDDDDDLSSSIKFHYGFSLIQVSRSSFFIHLLSAAILVFAWPIPYGNSVEHIEFDLGGKRGRMMTRWSNVKLPALQLVFRCDTGQFISDRPKMVITRTRAPKNVHSHTRNGWMVISFTIVPLYH